MFMSSDKSETVTLSWRNIEVTKAAARKKKKVLRNMSGVAKSGRILAIMGASRYEQATLLKALAHRTSGSLQVEGHIAVNKRPLVEAEVHRLSTFVHQVDDFFGILTVQEHLWLQAMLRIDQRIPNGDKEKRVDKVITETGLLPLYNKRIVNPGSVKGLDRGQRKLLSLATELLTNPSIIFCDEPTSDLDAFSAENIINILLDMATKGKTIVCTLYQPSSKIFNLFNDLLLTADGKLAYLGPLENAESFFTSQNYPCPPHCNLAEHYITTLSVVPGNEGVSKDKINRICNSFDSSPYATDLRKEVEGVSEQNSHPPLDRKKTANFFTQFRYIGWRSFTVEFRDMKLFLFKTVPLIFMTVIMGLIYLQQDYNQKGVQNLAGALFLFSALASYTNGFAVAVTMPLEFPIIRRDIENQIYSVFVYFLTKSLAELIIFSVLMFISSTIAYWMMGFRQDVGAWLIFTGTLIFMTDVSIGYSYNISCATTNVLIASSIFAPLVIPWMMFGGYVLNDASVPDYFIWLEYLSFFKYTNSILMANQWEGVTHIECEFTGQPNSTSSSRCFRNGKDVLVSYSYDKDYWARDFVGLTVLFVVYRITAFILLYFQMHGIGWLLKKVSSCCGKSSKTVHPEA